MTDNCHSPSQCSFETLGRRLDRELDHVANQVKEHSEKIIACVDNRVVPAVRSNSSAVLRFAAKKLSHLAELLET